MESKNMIISNVSLIETKRPYQFIISSITTSKTKNNIHDSFIRTSGGKQRFLKGVNNAFNVRNSW